MTDVCLRNSGWRVDAAAPLTDIGKLPRSVFDSSYLIAIAASVRTMDAVAFIRGNN
jgi:hypothetical protein